MSAPLNLVLASSTKVASISNQSIVDSATLPASATSAYELMSSGVARRFTNSGGYVNISGEWLVVGSASDFEARATLVSGTITSGTLDTWLVLSTSRSWSKTLSVVGDQTAVLTVEIRLAVGGLIVDSASISLQTIVEP